MRFHEVKFISLGVVKKFISTYCQADFFIFIADGFCCKYKLSKYLIRSKKCRPIRTNESINQLLLAFGLWKKSLIFIVDFRFIIEHTVDFMSLFARSVSNDSRPFGPGDL